MCIRDRVVEAMNKLDANDPEYLQKRAFYEAVIISYNAAINFAKRYSKKAAEMAATCTDPVRKAELLQISKNCDRVPENGAAISAAFLLYLLAKLIAALDVYKRQGLKSRR